MNTHTTPLFAPYPIQLQPYIILYAINSAKRSWGYKATLYERPSLLQSTSGASSSVIQPNQKVRNFAARLILLAPRHHHSTSLLQQLLWLPISERIKCTAACMCFYVINGSCIAYLFELLHAYTPSRTLRSSSDSRMLKIQQYKRKTHGFRTFTYFGPYVWNSLPQDIRQCSTLPSFKTKLKIFLFHSTSV